MGDSPINVPIEVRSHELQQTKDFIPRAEQRLRDLATDENELGEAADELARIYDEHVSGVGGRREADDFQAYLSMPADDWRAILRHTARLSDEEGLKVWWLRNKFVKRLRDRMEELEE